MIALYLIAAHLVGDFVFQTRWQAAGKFTDPRLRARHVLGYCVPFVPLAVVYAPSALWAAGFMGWLAVLHFLTDSRRFRSTLGDWVGWDFAYRPNPAARMPGPGATAADLYAALSAPIQEPLPPNPWPAMPILIDQTLHVCQVALLAGIFLS